MDTIQAIAICDYRAPNDLIIEKGNVYTLIDYTVEQTPVFSNGKRISYIVYDCSYALELNGKRHYINTHYEVFEPIF